MRNLKKVLSLVMAMVMTMSLATVALADTATTTTAATTTSTATNSLSSVFSDASSITNVKAVELLNNLGILAGSDGKFSPADTLTRAQAAKIISYLVLGATAAATLDNATTTTTSFTDMTGSEWANGYVAYCASVGIINGVGGNKFAPTDKVTTYQFAKMLLVAVGYGQKSEFTGSNWAANVATLAIKLGVMPKSTTNVALTRDNASLLAYNALFVPVAVYNASTGAYTTTTTIVKNSNTAYVDNDSLAAANYGFATVTGVLGDTTASGYYVETSNKYTANYDSKDIKVADADPTLIGTNVDVKAIKTTAMTAASSDDLVSGTVTNGKLADAVYGSKAVGTLQSISSVLGAGVVVSVNGGYTDGTDYFKLTGTLNADPTASTAAGYYLVLSNITGYTAGQVVTVNASHAVTGSVFTPVAGETIKLVDSYAYGGTDYSTDGFVDKIIVTNQSVSTLAAAATVASTGAVTLNGVTYDKGTVVYPSTLASGDVVTYYKNANTGITYYTKATTASGVITASGKNSIDKFVTVGGTQYTVSGLASSALDTAISAADYTNTYTLYLDGAGYVVKAVNATNISTAANYAVIAATTQTLGTYTNAQAKLVFADGTTSIVPVAKVGSTVISSDATTYKVLSDLTDTLVTYTKDSNGSYILTSPTTVSTLTGVTNNTAALTVASGNGIVANSATVFFTKDKTTGAYSVYTGIANVPSLSWTDSATSDYAVVNSALAKVVLVVGSTASTKATDVVYLTGNTFTTYEKYYEFSVYENGVATTLKVAKDTATGAPYDLFTKATNGALYSIDTTDSNGYASKVTKLTPSLVTGIGASTGGSFYTNSDKAAYTYGSDVKVTYITNAEVFWPTSSTSAVATFTYGGIDLAKVDANDLVYVVATPAKVATAIFVEAVANPVTVTTALTSTNLNSAVFNNSAKTLTIVANKSTNVTGTELLGALTTAIATDASYATASVVDSSGNAVTSAALVAGDKVIITGADGTTTATYTIAYSVSAT
jgi:hypothetical protein